MSILILMIDTGLLTQQEERSSSTTATITPLLVAVDLVPFVLYFKAFLEVNRKKIIEYIKKTIFRNNLKFT